MSDSSTGKTIIVTKVFDEGCDLCLHMSKHDKVTFETFNEIAYQETKLDDIINHGNNLTKVKIYRCLEQHALNPDYTIDLPVYVFLSKRGNYVTHLKGAVEVAELRESIKEAIEKSPPE